MVARAPENGEDLAAAAAGYIWYHRIELAPGVWTESYHADFEPLWNEIRGRQAGYDLSGKSVLDVGCRDGLFSFDAEEQGAARVVGIDNDLSRGAVELAIPARGSKVEMHELNLLELTPERFGRFDVVLCYGVLYHLRFPVLGLRRLADVLVDGGLLLLETAMMAEPKLDDAELLWCPVERSPYEWTSCTFFNSLGLAATMRSIGMAPLREDTLVAEQRQKGRPRVARRFLVFRRDPATAMPEAYWEGTHELHTVGES